MFFLEKLLSNNGVKVVLSVNEGMFSMVVNFMTRKNKNTVGLNASWSLGYFPMYYSACTKFSDVCFVWGELQKGIYINSGDKSLFYVTSGYLGDYEFDTFKEGSKRYAKNER